MKIKFSVAKGLFAHMSVGQTYLHGDTQTHILDEQISVNQVRSWLKNRLKLHTLSLSRLSYTVV